MIEIDDLYPWILAFLVIVWVGSSLLTFAYSLYNEVGAARDLGYQRQIASQDRAARIFASWLREKHLYLIGIATIEVFLWLLVLTGPTGSGNPSPRGVLFTLGLDGINVFVCLLSVRSTVTRRRAQRAQTSK